MAPAALSDLTRRRPDAPPARGEPVRLTGRVLQEGGGPVANFVVEIWQADCDGRFDHPADRGNAPADRNFAFWGRAATDGDGRYAFRTIKPGPVAAAEGGFAAPHIAVTLLGSGLMRRLVTRVYFPDEPRNEADPLLRSIADASLRQRLIARRVADPEAPPGTLSLAFDIVLRGEAETPFLAD